jgi:hypothetical protein
MNAPKLSILLPNYNHAEFLPRAIESSLTQSFGDLELIAVDDASTDHSWDILQDYARRDSRIRLFRNERNSGVAATLNRALAVAQGTYVHGASSDDYILPGYYEAALGMLARFPHAGMALGKTRCINADDEVTHIVPGDWSDEPVYLSPDDLTRRMTNLGVPGPAIWRREPFLKAGSYNPALRWHCDWFALQVVAFRHGLCFIPEVFAVVREVESSYSNNQNRKPDLQHQVLQILIKELKRPEYRDVVPVFKASGVLSQFQLGFVIAAVTLDEPLDGVVDLLKGHVLPRAAMLLRRPEPAIRLGAARFLGLCGADGLLFDRELALAAQDRLPSVREAAEQAWQSIRRDTPKIKYWKHRLRRIIGKSIRKFDRFCRPLVHDRLEQLERMLGDLHAQVRDGQNQTNGMLNIMKMQLEDLTTDMAAIRGDAARTRKAA